MSAELTGGCQCGAVRYRVTGDVRHGSLCHCRMCQRATGNAFAPLVETTGVEWQGEPARFSSSDIAERGFCGTCGTPLFYRPFAGDVTELMIGTLDDPNAIGPIKHNGVESMVSWLHIADELPRHETYTKGADGGGPETIRPNQSRVPGR